MKKTNDEVKAIEKILKRDVYTVMELVRLGIFGSKSAVHWAIEKNYIMAVYITSHRMVILKDSIIEHLKKLNVKDFEDKS